MKKSIFPFVLCLLALTGFSQQYSSIGGLETLFKGKHRFTVALDERKKTLSFQTDAAVSVVTLETYTVEERVSRKGQEYTNIYYTKTGNTYTFDLTRPELKDKYAYWLKVSTGRNGVPLAEYYFQKKNTQQNNSEEGAGEEKKAAGETIIRTNATCTEGKTKLIAALKALDGVQNVTIDPRGTVNIRYSSDGTPYNELLSTINENGFNANNQPTQNSSANPCKKNDQPNQNKVKLTPNLLDATPGYKRAAIKFVPIKADFSKGYSDTKVYTWVDSLGKQHTATGKEILDEVNQLEEQLNERGHSLREKKPFAGLTFPLNKVNKNDFTNCVITNKLTKSTGPKIYNFGKPAKLKNLTIVKDMMDRTIYSYLGYVTTGAEFKQANMNSSASFTRSGNNASAAMQLIFQPVMYQKLKNCTVEVAEKLNGPSLFSTTVDIKKPTAAIASAQYSLNFGDAVEPQYMEKNYSLFSYDLLFANVGSILPPATKYPKPYFITLKFYDASGNLIQTYQPNDLVLNNQLPMPLNIPKKGGKEYAGFNYEFLDPGLHCFGFYAKSSGFSATYFSQGVGYDGINQNASVNANMEIGVKYYNWNRLIDNSAPLTNDYVLFGYDINSEEKYSKADNGAPGIRIKGYKNEDPDQGTVSLIGKSYDLNNTDQDYFSESIASTIANVDFFIGPVPCNITVSISGTASMKVDYQSSKYSEAKTTITPHADITMHGSGGVDAKIMYAKVFANVQLLTIDMPYTLEASGSKSIANIDPLLSVGGLSGEVYFKAGFCIPIPLVDDICESFRIDILNWKGFEKKFTIDPKKGISL